MSEGVKLKQAGKATDLNCQPAAGSLSEWCIDVCGGDPLLAVDLAVTRYEAMRRSATPPGAHVAWSTALDQPQRAEGLMTRLSSLAPTGVSR